jgi:hypothetical protein
LGQNSNFEVEKVKLPGMDQILAELIQADEMLCSGIPKVINSVWSKEELSDQWKESIVLSIYKKGNKTPCSNDRGISPLSTSYNIVSNILLTTLSPYTRVDEIIGDHQCGF